MYELEEVAPQEVELEGEIDQEDAWAVVSAFFSNKGLVRQQLDSFNEFINTTVQEIVDESSEIVVRPQSQHNPLDEGEEPEDKRVVIRFGQIYLSRPTMTEADGETVVLFPKEARLRNLT